MNGIMSIIHALSVLCRKQEIKAENIKITVEFLHPEDQNRAEYALRMGSQGIYADVKLIDSIVDGEPFTVKGFKFAVKRYEEPRPWCNCHDCQRRREAARR